MESPSQHALINTDNKKIVQVGIVVKNVHKTAKRYTEIFGIKKWIFVDGKMTDIVSHKKRLGDGTCSVRIALGNVGKIQFELIQPFDIQGTHAEFLEKHGEGVHHLSFGVIEDHDKVISALEGRGIDIDMSAEGNGLDVDLNVKGQAEVHFTYMDTVQTLGTRFEFVKSLLKNPSDSKIIPWGIHESSEPGFINIADKRIYQVGIIVENVEKVARNYSEIFGVGPWKYLKMKPPFVSENTLHGVKVISGQENHLRIALANLGGIEIELIEPVKGTSLYRDFLAIHGQGVQHVSFGACKDYDEMLSAMNKHQIDVAISGVLGGASRVTYMDTQKDLATLFEFGSSAEGLKNIMRQS